MRLTSPGTLLGTLGALVQQAMDGANMLLVKVGNLWSDDTSQAGQAFQGRVALGALAGNNNNWEIRNPVGSGIVVYLDSIDLPGKAAVETYTHGMEVAQLTTDAGQGKNKNAGGAASGAHLRTQQVAGGLATVDSFVTVQANGNTLRLNFSPPVRLIEGKGYGGSAGTVNTADTISFQWREKAT